HMGRCDGWCRPEMDRERHSQAIAQAVRLLEGKRGEVEEELTARMEAAAGALRFEEAAALRDRLRAIQMLGKRQKVLSAFLADTDVVGFSRGEAKSCFSVLHYVEGALAAKDAQLLDTSAEAEDSEVLSALVAQYYSGRGALPGQILLPVEIEDGPLLARLLSERSGRRVELVTPRRGAKAELIRLANKNAADEAGRAAGGEQRRSKVLEALGKLLNLSEPPRRIESYDISNTGPSDIVASMAVFSDGKPRKGDYRHFKLRGLTGPDDYAAMAQVLDRRFRRWIQGDEAFGALPDLILVDGGATHASLARRTLADIGLSVPVAGIVKDDRHRTRALVTPDGALLGIQNNPALFAFVGRIQEETHRSALQYHQLRRSQGLRVSALDGIPGVGKARKNALITRFKSVKRIKAASLAELEEVVPKPAAAAVYAHFHPAPEGDGMP
ncbi:MAG: excinuclease ABC subunit C, partial [Clostridiales bacterium]|nr:excinuclease ABC subunit C [Clostridiales bacterium]